MPFCRDCGNEIKANSRFCESCGADVSSDIGQEQRSSVPPKHEGKSRALITILLALIVLAIVLALGIPNIPRVIALFTSPQDWPCFRGNPAHTGFTKKGPKLPLTKKWAYQTENSVDSSPAVADGVVYVGSWDNNIYAFSND